MAYDMFLDIDGIPGEAMDSKYKDKIIVNGFSFGVSQSGSFAVGSGGGAGKADFTTLHISKGSDASSHLLFLNCANGSHIKQATLILRKAGGEQRDFMKVLMTDLLVSNFSVAGSENSDVMPREEVSFSFSSIKFSYAKQKQDGSMEAFKEAGWNLKENKKL
jgi:type VI secretion system secreted protein Hcp